MTSQGQRFRRRALRRGYKVDEVDGFLDRVEATIAGEPIDAPVTAQEVHDVVFRVRFGGYDEWQVDLHLDRVERQLTEATQPGPGYGPGPDPRNGGRPPERMGPPPERMGPPPERMGPPPGSLGHGPPPGAGPHGPGPHGPGPHGPGPGGPGPHGPGPHGPGGGPMGAPMPAQAGPPPGAYPDADYDRYDEPTYGGYDGREPARPGMINTSADRFSSDMTSEMRLGDPGGPPMPRPGPPDPGPAGPGMGGPGGPGMGGRGGAGGPGMGGSGGHGMAGHEGPGGPGGNGPGMGHDGPGPRGPGGPPAGPPMAGPSSPGFGPSSPGFGPSGPGFGPGMGGPEEAPHGDVQRLDQLRRTFQPRRFGSGYDRSQVDRLFEEVIVGVSGQGPMSVSDTDLDPGRFDLVPGGYFEAEVEQALHEVRDILRRQ